MNLFKRTPRISNLEESHRLPVLPHEPALREKLPTKEQMDAIHDAREYLFQNTPQILRLTKTENRVE